jgi:hypothetical protein
LTYKPFEELAVALHSRTPAIANALSLTHRDVDQGLLSVGLKLHCLEHPERFNELIDALGGEDDVLDINHYRQEQAYLSLVLPPMGSVKAALRLLESIEHYTGMGILNTPDVHVQVCSPGRLSRMRAGLLTLAFYLGTDKLRNYELWELETTFSNFKPNPSLRRGKRLVLYDAPYGQFDRGFEWWGKTSRGQLWRQPALPFEAAARTDILTAKSRQDIENINLVATLLSHSEYGGYWGNLGKQFEEEIQSLFVQRGLEHLLFAPWIRMPDSPQEIVDEDAQFLSAMEELWMIVTGEAEESRRLGWQFWKATPKKSILLEMKDLLQYYRTALSEEARRLTRSSQRKEA